MDTEKNHLKWKKNMLPDYLLDNSFFDQCVNNFLSLLYKTNVIDIFKSMWNNTVDNKTCNLNFSVTFDLSDEGRERSSASENSAELDSHCF